jgi:plastocyanin
MVPYKGPQDHPEEPLRPYRLSEKAVVYIDSIGKDTTYAPPDVHPTLKQYQMMFRPLVLPVVVGTTVDFPNKDNLYHNVFSYSQPKEFDLGRYPKGHSRSVTFNKPGIVKVYCDIHTYMYATILVLENPYFAVPDDDGSYVITDVPPGTYRVSCWYGRKNLLTLTVVVRAAQTSTADFAE